MTTIPLEMIYEHGLSTRQSLGPGKCLPFPATARRWEDAGRTEPEGYEKANSVGAACVCEFAFICAPECVLFGAWPSQSGWGALKVTHTLALWHDLTLN